MDKLAFMPLVDLPLTVLSLWAFIYHIHRWVHCRDIDTSIDVQARLPSARVRIIALFVGMLALCWLCDVAVWLLFAVLLGIGFVVALVSQGAVDGGVVGPLAAAFLIREWAFGFPQIILHPESPDLIETVNQSIAGELVGKTGVTTSPLRPSGEVSIEGKTYSALSADGRFVDTGSSVVVSSYRNGRLCVLQQKNAN